MNYDGIFEIWNYIYLFDSIFNIGKIECVLLSFSKLVQKMTSDAATGLGSGGRKRDTCKHVYLLGRPDCRRITKYGNEKRIFCDFKIYLMKRYLFSCNKIQIIILKLVSKILCQNLKLKIPCQNHNFRYRAIFSILVSEVAGFCDLCLHSLAIK